MEPEATQLLQDILAELRRQRNGGAVATVREVLTLEEAAEYLRFSPHTVREKMRLQLIPYYRVKGTIRFRKSKLDAWLNAGEIIEREPRESA
jgi:excisionase family DNA binding protein